VPDHEKYVSYNKRNPQKSSDERFAQEEMVHSFSGGSGVPARPLARKVSISRMPPASPHS